MFALLQWSGTLQYLCEMPVSPTERSQSEKATYHMIPAVQNSGKDQTMETAKRLVFAKRWGWRRNEQAEHRGILEQ